MNGMVKTIKSSLELKPICQGWSFAQKKSKKLKVESWKSWKSLKSCYPPFQFNCKCPTEIWRSTSPVPSLANKERKSANLLNKYRDRVPVFQVWIGEPNFYRNCSQKVRTQAAACTFLSKYTQKNTQRCTPK